MGVVWGGGGNIFLAFYAIPTFLEKINYGNKKINIFLFYRKTIVDRDSGNIYPIGPGMGDIATPPRRRPGDGRYCNAPRPSVCLSVCLSCLVFAL